MEHISSESSIRTHVFEETIEETPMTFYIINMKECLFVWVGDTCKFDNLAVAMKTPYSSLPVSTAVMGHFTDENSCSLATRLSNKTGKQVFASCNFSKMDSKVLLSATKRLMEELTKNSE